MRYDKWANNWGRKADLRQRLKSYYLHILLTIFSQLMRVLHTHTHSHTRVWIISIIVLRSTFIRAKQKQLEWKCLISFFGKWNATQSRQSRDDSPRGTRVGGSRQGLQSCHQHFEIQWTLLWPKFRCQVLRLCVVCCVNGKYFSFSLGSSPL